VEERLAEGARVVDQDVDVTEFGMRALDHRLDLRLVADIGADEHAFCDRLP
jgi:hypothetical protein